MALCTESLLEREPNLSPRTREYLETAQRSIDDVAHTVGRMREFSRQHEPELMLVAVDLNRLVQQVVDLTRARWRDMPLERGFVIQVHTLFEPALPPIGGRFKAMFESAAQQARPIDGEETQESKREWARLVDTCVCMCVR